MESSEAPDNSQNESFVEDEAIAEDEVIVEDETVVEDGTVVEDKVAVEETTSTKTESTKAESAKAESTKAESAKAAPAETASAQTESIPSEQPHEHNWIAHTNQRWVSQIVTVVDEPERYEEYGMCRMYWYNTGTWEESRDPSRFVEWSHSEYGALYPFLHLDKSEDSPLYLGYDEHGNPSYLCDHALWTEHVFVPVVTHEEDQGYYKTYVDYYYCDCGAAK